MPSNLNKLMIGAALAGQLATTVATLPLFAEDTAGKAETAKPAAATKPHIDLAFCIDTTGSMSAEIENVKAKTKELVAKLAGGKPTPVIRVGLVAFRDRGDEYVTKVFPFSEDIDKVVKDISSLRAGGGGDAPEAVNQALHASLNDLKWSANSKTLKLLFLIGDAGPNPADNAHDWKTEAKSAISRGIQINTLGCQGLEQFSENEGVGVFKQIAKLADGKFESLAYRTEIVNAEGKTETVIASGGSTYRLKGKSRDAWKDGAAALSARGEAERFDMPASAGFMTRGGGRSFRAAAAPMAMGAYAGRAGGGAGSGDAMSVSRAENNLADVVLNATKEAAAKKLNVEFKEK